MSVLSQHLPGQENLEATHRVGVIFTFKRSFASDHNAGKTAKPFSLEVGTHSDGYL